jgi:HPt (histidine-containing phosphotransfer) domain-containing protein
MNDHIGKPIDPDHLVATLAKWVRPTRSAEGSAHIEAAPKTVSASTEEKLPNLPGVKVSASVRRIGGNIALYYSLLEKFRINEMHVISQIREALAANDPKTAERLAHTLKGIAGTLGAESLQSLSEQLEKNIKNGVFDNFESLMSQTGQEVIQLIKDIDHAIEMRSS